LLTSKKQPKDQAEMCAQVKLTEKNEKRNNIKEKPKNPRDKNEIF
jgi:hypothetical protein